MRKSEIFVLSFSGGRTSAYMTDRLLKELPRDNVIVCFANTGKEEPETLDFVDRCDKLWGNIIHWLEYCPLQRFRRITFETASRQGEPYAAIIAKRKYLPNVVARFCTQELKVRVIKRYLQSLGYRYWTSVIGIRFDEPKRWAKIQCVGKKECWDTWLPLVDWKITKPDVLQFWRQMPFDLQLKDYQGNCDLCFLKGKNKIKQLITEQPERASCGYSRNWPSVAVSIKQYSYSQIVELIKTMPTLFDQPEEDYPCHCNID